MDILFALFYKGFGALLILVIIGALVNGQYSFSFIAFLLLMILYWITIKAENSHKKY